MFISLSDAKLKVWPQEHFPTPELDSKAPLFEITVWHIICEKFSNILQNYPRVRSSSIEIYIRELMSLVWSYPKPQRRFLVKQYGVTHDAF